MRSAILIICWCTWVNAQELSVRGPDPGVVRLGERAILTLVVDGSAEPATLGPLPRIPGIDVVARRPQHSTVQSLIDGEIRVSPRASFEIVLEPRREGVFALPKFSVDAGSRTLTISPGDLEAVKDAHGKRYAFLETGTPRDTYFVGEEVQVVIRIGFDAAFFETNVIQISQQHLDLPAWLRIGWLEEFPGADLLPSDPEGRVDPPPTYSLAIDDNRSQAVLIEERMIGGRSFTVVGIEKSFRCRNSGRQVIPAPLLRFSYATEFRDDFVHGRMPIDPKDAFAYGEAKALTILPLPEESCPPEFTGAVGRFQLQAEVDHHALTAGESLKLVLTIRGEGNLESFGPPRVDSLEGFHIAGMIDDRGERLRTVTYDLVPLHDLVVAIPPLRFAFFDPTPPGSYHVVMTKPIPLEVKPLPPGMRLVPLLGGSLERTMPGLNDIFDLESQARLTTDRAPDKLSPWLRICSLLLPWLLASALLIRQRSRTGDARDPARIRARRAAEAFRACLATPGADPGETLTEYLAARLRCSAAAVISPDLNLRLQTQGVSPDFARRAASTLESLVGYRYGGRQAAQAASDAGAVVAGIEEALSSRENRR